MLVGDANDTDDTQTNSLGIDFGHHRQADLPSPKSKGNQSIIGWVFRGVGTVFGKEAGLKAQTQTDGPIRYPAYFGCQGDSSNTNSAPNTPGPSSTLAPAIRVPYNVPTLIAEVSETEDQSGSPPPDVLRQSDNSPPLQSRARPPPATTISSNPSNQRPKSVSRKPVNTGALSSRFVEPETAESVANLEDRTTVIIYEHNVSRAPTGAQIPQVISRHPSSTGTGTGLPPFQPLRPTSFAATRRLVPNIHRLAPRPSFQTPLAQSRGRPPLPFPTFLPVPIHLIPHLE
jgi:hypothetical protein